MKSKFIGFYLIFLFLVITGYWIMTLSGKTYTEGQIEIAFHVVSELMMATICLLGGILLLLKHPIGKKLSIAGSSMIIYSVLNAAGYFGERNDVILTTMFIVLLVISIVALSSLVFNKQE